jgi:hypothetical protein
MTKFLLLLVFWMADGSVVTSMKAHPTAAACIAEQRLYMATPIETFDAVQGKIMCMPVEFDPADGKPSNYRDPV